MNIEALAPVFAIVVVLLLVGYLFYALAVLAYEYTRHLRDLFVLKVQNSVHGHLKEEYDQYLAAVPYYQKLPADLKVKFILRVKNFIASKQFESREQLEITEEMKTLVAASAVQLTFGLNRYLLDHFERIILYPDSYFSPIGKAYHMGETNPRGIIVLSWKDLQKGFSTGSDTYNVGLHEMAHALELGLLLQEDYDFYFGQYFIKWSNVATQEYQNLSEERESFLRTYAGVNRREFFAVCIEYFFEASKEFKERLPQIYYHLCILLNQDPLSSDTHVEQVKRKDFKTLREEIENYAPAFVTDYSIYNMSPGLLLPPIAFLVMGLYDYETFGFAFFPLFAVFALTAVLVFFRLNKILLYDQYLSVKSMGGTTKAVYYLDDIVCVDFYSENNGGRMKVIRAENGKIITRTHAYISKDKVIEELTAKLKKKDVLVR